MAYGVLLITSKLIKQPKKARRFTTRLLCSRCINSFFFSNVKINDLNHGNIDIKDLSLAKELTYHKISCCDSLFPLFTFIRYSILLHFCLNSIDYGLCFLIQLIVIENGFDNSLICLTKDIWYPWVV